MSASAGKGAAGSPAVVLLMVTGSHIGGTEKIVSLLARGLDRSRYRPVVCSVKPPGAMAREVSEAGVEFFSLGFAGGGLPAAGRALGLMRPLCREIRRRDVDLVHSFLFLANMLGRSAAFLTRRPSISSVRGEDWGKGLYPLAERLTSPLVTAYVTPSRHLAELTSSRSGVRPARISVIANAVEEPPPADGSLRRLCGAAPGEFLVGVVGRLHREKGQDILIEAMALLPPGDRPALAIIGDGPERGNLDRECRRLGLGSRVRFTGWVPGAAASLGDLDLLVVPSRSEGMPNVVLEAQAAGVPVLAAAVGGVPEAVEDGVSGFLVPPGDPAALALAIRRILRDSPAARRAAAGAIELARGARRPAAMVEKFQDLYDKILGGRSPS